MNRHRGRTECRVRRVIWVAVASLVIAGIAGFLWKFNNGGWNKNKAERIINTALPIGSSRASVESWLKASKIEYFYDKSLKRDAADTFRNPCLLADWNYAAPESVGLSRQDLRGMVYATINHANVSCIWDGEIDIFFFFDKSGWLVGHRVEEFVEAL